MASAQTVRHGLRRRKPWRSHLYLQFIAVAAFLLLLEILLAQVSLVQPRITQLDDLQKKRLDIYLDVIKLLITASGVTLGAITGFVLNRDKGMVFTDVQLRKVIASWALAGISLYCGYLSIQQVIWMLYHRFFDLYDPHILLPSRAQFLTLLAAIAVFADFIHGTLKRKEKNDATH